MNKTNKTLRANAMLLLTSFIWGAAFVAQSLGMDYIGPFTFNAFRFLLASLFLLPIIPFLSKKNAQQHQDQENQKGSEYEKTKTLNANNKKDFLLGGFFCGVFLFIGSAFQQLGIVYTSVGNAGFITTLYIVIVPLAGIFVGKKIPARVWIAVIIAITGLYLLCIPLGKGLGELNRGDFYMLICAFAFAGHILIVDYFSNKTDSVKLSEFQFIVASILNFIIMFIFESASLANVLLAWKALLYTGFFSAGVGYTLQIIAQKDTAPEVASLILSLESVFAAICGYLLLGEVKSLQEIIACCIIFFAIILVQLPSKRKS